MSQTKAQLLDPVDLSIVTADLADDAVTAAKLASNAVVNASVDASAAIQGTKISPDFGSQNVVTTGTLGSGNFTVSNTQPEIFLQDTDSNSDFKIQNVNGVFKVLDATSNNGRFTIASDGTATFTQNLNANSGLDVLGNVTTTGSITITSAAPNLLFTESDANPDFGVLLSAGQLKFQDVTNTANILTLDSSKIQAVTNLDALAGIDVTGNIVGTADLTVNTSTLKVDSSNSRVGVGTASPSTILHIKTSNPDVHLENTGTGTGQLRLGHFTNSAFIGTYNDDGGASDALRLGTHSGNERMRITSDGKVGIGTSSPTDALSVVGDINLMDNGTIFGGDDAANTLILRSTSGNANHSRIDVGVSEGSDNGGLHFYTAGSSEATRRITIKGTSGNVGIGTTSPQENLHILSSSGSSRIRMTSADGSDNMIVFGDTSDQATGAIKFDHSDNSLALFGFNNTERLRIDSSGRLLIGISSSLGVLGLAAQLQIAGDSAGGSSLALRRFGDSAQGAFLTFSKSRNAADGSRTIAQNGDELGRIPFCMDDGNDLLHAGAEIRANVDGTPGQDDTPGRLVFMTTADGASSPTERIRIDSAGTLFSFSTDDTTPNIKFRSNDANWFGSLNQSVHGATISTFLSNGGDWSADGTTYSATKALAGFETRAIAIHNQFNNGAGKVAFLQKAAGSSTTDGTVTEILKIDNDGIKFGSDTAAANALDDYEEGSWTPIFDTSISGGSITVNGYDIQSGFYRKVGSLVYVEGAVRPSSPPTKNSNGTWDIGGLPFTAASGGTDQTSGQLFGGAQQSWSVAPDKFTVIASNTRARAREGLDDGASTYSNGNTTMFNTSDSNVNRVFFSGTYIAA